MSLDNRQTDPPLPKQQAATDPTKVAQITDHANLCVECLDHIAALKCHQCDDQYCDLCFSQLHRSGFRSLHTFDVMDGMDIKTIHLNDFTAMNGTMTDDVVPVAAAAKTTTTSKTQVASEAEPDQQRVTNVQSKDDIPDHLANVFLFYPLFDQRIRYIALRLTDDERKLLQILESAVHISEYTDKVDVLQMSDRLGVISQQLAQVYSLISALYLAGNYKPGKKKFLSEDSTFYDNHDIFQHVFEIGRRHKIRNPDKLRSSYGKIMAIAMDSKLVNTKFGFDLAIPIRSVQTRCQQWGIESLLTDPLLRVATCQIDLDSPISREDLQQALEIRNNAAKKLATKYSKMATDFISSPQYQSRGLPIWYDDTITPSGKVSPDDITFLISSVSDAHQYLYQAFTPLQKVHDRLNRYFKPGKQVCSIGISNGVGGSVLTHNTDFQYHYVNESFQIWTEVLKKIHIFFFAADQDLLGGYSQFDRSGGMQNLKPVNYQLRFGDQGIQRLQSCPRVGALMNDVISAVYQRQGGKFYGSSVVHLADDAVPNALIFIDKYIQVERILSPLNKTITIIEAAIVDEKHYLHRYMHDYMNKLKTSTDIQLHHYILADFFKHAFNGSGATSRFFSGSCVDGRLTSCYEWCNNIEKKTYFQACLITGFAGFN